MVRRLLFALKMRRIERRLWRAQTLADICWVLGELGMPLDHLTDDELRESFTALHTLVTATGMRADEATRALASLTTVSVGR